MVRAHVQYLLDHGFEVTVASRTVSKAEAISTATPTARRWPSTSTTEPERLEAIVADHDLAVSLLPWALPPEVARACIDHGKHMVTTSYVKDEMKALDADAKDKGIILLNEIGVDPGIDHMTAMKVIHKVQADGGEITTFQSYCGGLPAPEANDNPFGYKFSWSPRGVLLAGLNDARYRRDGKDRRRSGRGALRPRVAGPGGGRGRADRVRGLPQPRQHALHRVLRHRPRATSCSAAPCATRTGARP